MPVSASWQFPDADSCRGPRAILVLQARKERLAHRGQDRKVQLGRKVKPDSLVPKAPKVRLARKDPLGLLALRASLDCPGPWARSVIKVIRVIQEVRSASWHLREQLPKRLHANPMRLWLVPGVPALTMSIPCASVPAHTRRLATSPEAPIFGL